MYFMNKLGQVFIFIICNNINTKLEVNGFNNKLKVSTYLHLNQIDFVFNLIFSI